MALKHLEEKELRDLLKKELTAARVRGVFKKTFDMNI